MKAILSLVMATLLATVSFAQDGEMTAADKLLMQVQKICPVSGKALGDGAIKTEKDGQTLFVCCGGCKDKAPGEKHMKTIMARFAKAQGNCPVMKKKTVKASSKMVMVKGQPVFACCARCVKKIEGDGEKFVKAVHANYKNFVGEEMQMAAQKICPISGHDLGDSPIKMTREDGETVYLCCEGCKGKDFDEKHWATIQANQAKAQGTCPVMGKKVDAKMKSTVVNGRRIFVCCPPCIKKIEADPETYVAKLNDQIAAAGDK